MFDTIIKRFIFSPPFYNEHGEGLIAQLLTLCYASLLKGPKGIHINHWQRLLLPIKTRRFEWNKFCLHLLIQAQHYDFLRCPSWLTGSIKENVMLIAHCERVIRSSHRYHRGYLKVRKIIICEKD